MSQGNTVPPMLNRTMKFILRSPLHGLVSKSVLLISFTGRKSGKTYTTPVSYSQTDGQVTIFTHAKWWKNLHDNAQVTLRLRGQEVQGLAQPVAEDKQAIAAALLEHLRVVPSDARYYGVSLDEHGNPNTEETRQGALDTVMVRIQLC